MFEAGESIDSQPLKFSNFRRVLIHKFLIIFLGFLPENHFLFKANFIVHTNFNIFTLKRNIFHFVLILDCV